MEKKTPAYLLACGAVFFERFAYYAMRAVLVLMLVQQFAMDHSAAYKTYGWFTALIYMVPVVAAVFADFIIGRKISVLSGLALSAAGAFSLTIVSANMLMLALFLIIAGTSFFKPAFYALIGDIFDGESEDAAYAGFAGVYLVINVGAMAAPFLVGGFANAGHFNAAMYISCCAYLAALVFAVLLSRVQIMPQKQEITSGKILIFFAALVLTFFYFTAFEVSDSRLYYNAGDGMQRIVFHLINPVAVIVFCSIFVFVFFKIKIHAGLKLAAGAVLGIAGLAAGFAAGFTGGNLGLATAALIITAAAESILSPLGYALTARNMPRVGRSCFFALYMLITGFAANFIAGYLVKMFY